MGNFCVARKAIPKFLLYMRLIAFFMFVTCLHVHANGIAQTKISVSLNNAPIKHALLSIQKNSSYRFIYNDDILPSNVTVTLIVKDADVHEVMDSVLIQTNLTYRILENNLIVISEKKQKQATPVKGNVQVKNKLQDDLAH